MRHQSNVRASVGDYEYAPHFMEGIAPMSERVTARIVPARPITVAIAEDDGRAVVYGVLANVSDGGACLWTDGFLRVGMHLRLQISFAQPAEMHEATGLVVWGQMCRANAGETRKYGLEWRGTAVRSWERLRELAGRPVAEQHLAYTPPATVSVS